MQLLEKFPSSSLEDYAEPKTIWEKIVSYIFHVKSRAFLEQKTECKFS